MHTVPDPPLSTRSKDATPPGPGTRTPAVGQRIAYYLGAAAVSALLGIALVYAPPVFVFGLLAAGLLVVLVLLKPYWGATFIHDHFYLETSGTLSGPCTASSRKDCRGFDVGGPVLSTTSIGGPSQH